MGSPARTIYLRADADQSIGLGHAGRLRAIADALRKLPNLELRWIGRATETMTSFVSSAGIELLELDEEEFAASKTAELAAGGVLVIDSYAATERDLESIASANIRQLLIDDFAAFESFPVEAVVNPNLHGPELSYPGARRVMAGLDFVLLRDEISRIRDERDVPSSARRIAVCMGGGDAGGVSAIAAGAIAELAGQRELEADVLVANPESVAATEQALAPMGDSGSVRPLDDWASVLAQCDLAITAAGVLKYETASAGVPSLIVAAVEHQREPAEQFAKLGTCEYLGVPDDGLTDRLRATLAPLFDDAPRRRKMREAGMRLVDGRGANRVAAVLDELRR